MKGLSQKHFCTCFKVLVPKDLFAEFPRKYGDQVDQMDPLSPHWRVQCKGSCFQENRVSVSAVEDQRRAKEKMATIKQAENFGFFENGLEERAKNRRSSLSSACTEERQS